MDFLNKNAPSSLLWLGRVFLVRNDGLTKRECLFSLLWLGAGFLRSGMMDLSINMSNVRSTGRHIGGPPRLRLGPPKLVKSVRRGKNPDSLAPVNPPGDGGLKPCRAFRLRRREKNLQRMPVDLLWLGAGFPVSHDGLKQECLFFSVMAWGGFSTVRNEGLSEKHVERQMDSQARRPHRLRLRLDLPKLVKSVRDRKEP